MTRRLRVVAILCAAGILGSCSASRNSAPPLTVAAAANLTNVFQEIGNTFQAKTGIHVIFSYGATAQLGQQIDNGAPFDLFASADSEHVDSLVKTGKLSPESRAIYSLGQLALWIPNGEKKGVRDLKGLTASSVRFIALAQPNLAPYGRAAVEALTQTGLWESLKPKIVYGTSVSHAKQLAQSGNAEAAFTAYSLVLRETGTVLKVDSQLYRPIEQALAIVSSSKRKAEAQQFRSFLLGEEGQAILTKNGYLRP